MIWKITEIFKHIQVHKEIFFENIYNNNINDNAGNLQKPMIDVSAMNNEEKPLKWKRFKAKRTHTQESKIAYVDIGYDIINGRKHCTIPVGLNVFMLIFYNNNNKWKYVVRRQLIV